MALYNNGLKLFLMDLNREINIINIINTGKVITIIKEAITKALKIFLNIYLSQLS